MVDVADQDPRFVALLESAAHLQRLVPGAVMVGGSAAILYADQNGDGQGVATQLVRQLSKPGPVDRSVIDQLSSYRRLRKRWSDWPAVTDVLGEVASRMVSQ